MMRRRAMRPGRGVVGTVATAAVVAGTAGAVHHRQQQRWANQAAEQQAAQQTQVQATEAQIQQAQAQEAAAAAASAAPASDLTTELSKLAQLHDAGALTDDEYSAAKAKLLA